MNQILSDLGIKLIPGLIIAVFTSYFTVKLSIRRFYAEKWWEKKQEIYSRLIEALHYLKRYFSEKLEDVRERGHLNEEKEEKLKIEYSQASMELDKIKDLASLLLSQNAVSIIEKYEKDEKEALQSNSFYDYLDHSLVAVEECLKKIKIEAKIDLKIH